MDETLLELRQRLIRRCRIWVFGGYGLLLAGAALLFFTRWRGAWILILAGIVGRIMHHLELSSLRTMNRLAEHDQRASDRRVLDARTASPGGVAKAEPDPARPPQSPTSP